MKILVLLFILVWVASALDVDTALAESLRFGGPSTQDGLCAELGARMGLGSVSASAAPWPRIFDAFLVGDDLDMLEIRLYELHTVVDFFVIAESNTTFTLSGREGAVQALLAPDCVRRRGRVCRGSERGGRALDARARDADRAAAARGGEDAGWRPRGLWRC